MRRALLMTLLIVPCLASAQQPGPPAPVDPAKPQFVETVEVVAVTPLHGIAVPKWQVPANVQAFTSPRPPDLGPPDPAGLLGGRAASVHVNDIQAGTFQPDVMFRGFAGSPLLGSSEGLAVYQNGVRINEAFGDTVNWDVLPSTAVSSVNLIPGSNPLFGLNTLGGAVSIRTKDGFADAGGQGSVRTGSFGRHDVEGGYGGHGDRFAYYVAGSLSTESGWRDFSPSTVRRVFADAAWRVRGSQVNVNLTGASNDLTANGPAPLTLLEREPRAVFTHPDRTDNDVTMLTARILNPALDGVAYYRHSGVRTFNGDTADDEGDESFDALNNRSHTRAHSIGATVQHGRRTPLWRRDNLLVVGAGFDAAAARFDFGSEWANLTDDRGTTGSGLFDDQAFVALHTRGTTASAFVTNVWSATGALSVTASARLNWTAMALRDQLGTDLDGDHRFARLNPAVGLTYQLTPAINLYGSYAQSSRVPTPVELTCADPEDPCRLPNAFVSDPPLEQIVASTWEAGARGATGRFSWSLSAYDTSSLDDIIFVSSGTLRGEGHFENVDRTQRRGIEAAVAYDRADRVSLFANYTLQRAAFGTDLVIASQFHPRAVGAEIRVEDGSWLPGVPAHSAKAGISGRLWMRLDAGVTLRAQSGQFLRGDEGNLLDRVPGFATADVHGRWRLSNRLAVVGRVSNVLDASYYTFGVLGDASLLGPEFEEEGFYSPAPPRAASIGAELRF